MRKSLILIIVILWTSYLHCQTFYLKAEGQNTSETQILDSLSYKRKFTVLKDLVDENKTISEKLIKSGYLEHKSFAGKQINDSTFLYSYSLGKQTKSIHIYIGDVRKKNYLDFWTEQNEDYWVIGIHEVEEKLQSIVLYFEKKGFPLTKVSLTNINNTNKILYANLKIESGNERKIQEIVMNGYDKFPEGHLKSLTRQYRNLPPTQQNLFKINKDLEKFRFIKTIKGPEILFQTDSTKVYVYVEKTKSNKFDGFIGFSNDEESGFKLNGYVDLLLSNALNSGEQFMLYWKNDGNKQTTFNVGLDLDYLFKTQTALKTDLQIFRQDSIFQNTQFNLKLGYLFDYNTRLYLGLQTTESISTQNNITGISDYKSRFFTSTFEFVNFNHEDRLFPDKSMIHFNAGFGKRNSENNSENQFFGLLEAHHNLYLNSNNLIYVKNISYYLKSESYLTNELFRFGGIYSFRGFNENSLQASLMSALITEYRYIINSGLYVHSIIDYGYFQDKSTDMDNSLIGLGLGFGLRTKGGLLNFVYANGSTKDNNIKLSNSIVHISLKAGF